jgi:hypothetical protein
MGVFPYERRVWRRIVKFCGSRRTIMHDTVIHTIAEYLDTTHEEVAYWDKRLVNYFVHHPAHFNEFRHGNLNTRFLAWMQALRTVAVMA